MDNVDTRETRLVADWSAALAEPGERFLSWALLAYAKPPGQAGRDLMSDYLATRGLDPARQVALHETQAFAVLTDTTLRLGLYGGMFRFKPKTLVATSGAAGFRLEWWDESRMVADERHMLMIYDDGTWSRHSAMVARRSNVEVFVEALGDRAVCIER